ncbi:MAG: ABC transporter permease [Acidimicrobiales bacterium]
MGSYLARRLMAAGPTLGALSFVIFLLGAVAGDPSERLASAGLEPGEVPTQTQIEAVRHELGLDRPLGVRYVEWAGQAVQGDLGRSLFTQNDVVTEVVKALPATLRLTVAAMLAIVVLSLPLGLVAALTHRRWPDSVLRLLALAGASTPGFFLAYALVLAFAVKLNWLPVVGMGGIRHVILPALTLALGPAALVSRLLRSSTIEVLGEGFIGTARAKGLATSTVLVGHALRNAAIPVLTVLGSVMARLLEGAVIVEIIFAWPGIGKLTFDAVTSADYPMVQGTVLFAGVVFILANLFVDLSYGVSDPRIRLGTRR